MTTNKRFIMDRKYNYKDGAALFMNKKEFYKKYAEYVKREWIYVESSSQAKEFINKHKKVIVKPFNESQGKGIYIVNADNNLNFDGFVGYLLEEIITQDENISKFHPSSLYTIRTVTLTTKSGTIKILNSYLRMGVGGAVVDNASAGGIFIAIDSNTGQLEKYAYDSKNNQYEIHPTTKTKFKSVKIPNWEEYLNLVIDVTSKNFKMRMVGWDFAVTSDGFVLVEGNTGIDETGLQLSIQKGLYKEIKKFLKK